MKKIPVDIIILHKCIQNHDHMLYCSWDMACDECTCYFSFWAIFCPFSLQQPEKSKFQKKMKKIPRDIIILHWCTKNHDHMLHCYWDMVCDRCNCYFPFWTIFCPFIPILPLTAQKWKNLLEISSFCTCVPEIMIRWCMVLRYGAQQTEERTEKVIYWGGCPT